MPLESRDKAYLWDMLDAARAIKEFVKGKTQEDYRKNRMLRGAVERHIEIIGEAARHISDEMRSSHPEIPWRSIVGQRNILAHDYGEISDEMVWKVAASHIPGLIAAIEKIMPGEKSSEI